MMIKTTGGVIHKIYQPIFNIFLLIIFLTLSFSWEESSLIPVTGSSGIENPYITSPIASKLAFVDQVVNGNPEQITGVWLPDLTGLVVHEQPKAQPGFVSDQPGIVTNFQLAADFGSIGLLAHAHLAGAFFNKLDLNQVITIIYGDGSMVKYQVTEIRQYQAMDPGNTLTDFTSMDQEGKVISQKTLFYEIYSQPGRLILQTCIIFNNENLWGRKFTIATKVE